MSGVRGTIPAAMMSVFLVMMLIPDVGNRGQKYSEERTIYAAERVDPNAAAGVHGVAHGDHSGDEHADGDAAEHDSH
jgi:hypothetical protein